MTRETLIAKVRGHLRVPRRSADAAPECLLHLFEHLRPTHLA